MARRLLGLCLAWLATLTAASGATPQVDALRPSSLQRLPDGQQLLVLCYHDVLPVRDAGADPESVDTATLAAHLNWLRSEGFHPIGLDAVAAAYAGSARLPERAVLLTFDDGYASLYTQVYPLLRAFRFPAVAALVGQWMEAPAGQPVRYSERQTRAREQFISWPQALEMQASGLVEFASHTWDLHQGIAGNPDGSLEPAATTHAFVAGSYETDAAWMQRIRADLDRNSALLQQRLGRRPRAIVWPYGRYNDGTERIARELGMAVGLTLDSGPSGRPAPIGRIRRLLVDGNPGTAQLSRMITHQDDDATIHFVQVPLDPMAGLRGAELDQRLGELLGRIRQLGVETVVLPAFARPGASGRIEAAYFPNRGLPVRADLLNRVAWAVATRTRARVVAWLPLDGYAPPSEPGATDPDAALGDLLEDLGKAVYLQGLLLGPAAPDASVEAAGARAAALAGRARAWQPQLRTALKLPSTAQALSPDRIAALLQQHDYLQADLAAPDDRSPQAGLLPALRSLAGAPARTLIGLAAPPGAAATIGARAQALQSDGFPNLGVTGADLAGGALDLDALRRALSLRAQPVQAGGP